MAFKVKVGLSNIPSKIVTNNENDPGTKNVCLRKVKCAVLGNQSTVSNQVLKHKGRAPLGSLKTDALGQIQNNVKVTSNNENGAKFASTSSTYSIAPRNVEPTNPVRAPFKVFNEIEDNENQNIDPQPSKIVSNELKTVETTAKSWRQPLATLNMNPALHEDTAMVVDATTLETSSSVSEASSSTVRKIRSQISDELLVEDYAKDIYNYLRELEIRFSPKPTYMTKQPDVTCGMRSILVDWLVEVSEEYRLRTETLYLAVSYIDRFLSCMSVLRGKLQLVGTASMLIAAKFEEIYPPEVEEFVFITDDTYTQSQVLRMEQVILKVLKFDLAAPTAYSFLQRFSILLDVEEQCYHLAMYLCELTLLESDPYLQYSPSIIAGSALCLACHTLERQLWSSEMIEFTGYTLDNFRQCCAQIFKTYQNAADYPQQAIREKYRSVKYSCVANLTPPLVVPFSI